MAAGAALFLLATIVQPTLSVSIFSRSIRLISG
jgi:hypothetical protein